MNCVWANIMLVYKPAFPWQHMDYKQEDRYQQNWNGLALAAELCSLLYVLFWSNASPLQYKAQTHREALATKKMPQTLKTGIQQAVHVINYIKEQPLNSHSFSVLWQEMGSDHQHLLFHTQVSYVRKRKSSWLFLVGSAWLLGWSFRHSEFIECFYAREGCKYPPPYRQSNSFCSNNGCCLGLT